jgi:ribonuclease BN (tRNA processing enzyme)
MGTHDPLAAAGGTGAEDRLEVITLGVGDAFSARTYQTSLLLSAGGRMTLIDIPDPPRKAMAEAGRELRTDCGLERVDDVIVTHVHGDHANGLECYGFFKRFVQKRRPRLWSIPDVFGPLWENKLKAGMGRLVEIDLNKGRDVGPEEYFEFRHLSFGSAAEVNGLRVEIHAGLHTVPVFGVRVEYRGRRFGYSSDTTFLPEMIEFLSPCHLIFHETNYGPHTPYAKLAALPAELRSRMRLVHYPDDFDQAASVIECAQPARRYVV